MNINETELKTILNDLPLCSYMINFIYDFIKPYTPKTYYVDIVNYPNSPFCKKKKDTPYYVRMAQLAIKLGAQIGDFIVDSQNKYYSPRGTLFLVVKNPHEQFDNEYNEHSFYMWRDTSDFNNYKEFIAFPRLPFYSYNKVLKKLSDEYEFTDKCIIDITDFKHDMSIEITKIYNEIIEIENESDTENETPVNSFFTVMRFCFNIFGKKLYIYEDIKQFFPYEHEFNDTIEERNNLLEKARWVLLKTRYILFRTWPLESEDEDEHYFPFSGAFYDIEFKRITKDNKKYYKNCTTSIILDNFKYEIQIGSLFN